MIKIIKELLLLKDAATDADVLAAVRELKEREEQLQAENRQLKDDEAKRLADIRQQQETQAAALVDAAIRDGRINADARRNFLKLFDQDFEAAKASLDAIPARQSVAEQIEKNAKTDLKDFSGSWDELDRAGKLPALKDQAPELFMEKFKEKFGTEYKK